MLADRVRIGRNKEEVYLAQDDDFVKVNNWWVYRGSKLKIEIPHVIQGEIVTSYDYMFHGTGSYLATPVTKVVSNNEMITSMTNMFRDSSATTLDLSSFDTSSVTIMTSMFYGSSATTLDLSSFDTSNVTGMAHMFRNSSATTLDLSSFDTSNVTSMASMFYNSSATTIDLSSFDTSNVTNMSYMFRDSSATTLDLSSFDTSNVTNMSYMFRGSSAATLDLSSFDTSNVTNMDYMFYISSATTGYARTQADADRFNASSNKPANLNFIVPDDFSGSPGNRHLIAGDMEAGYFGEVSASELITGDDLALRVGISEGTSQNSTGGWLKFAYKDKVQFVAKKPIRHSISWNSINSANCVFGGAVIEIGGLSYKVRLFSTANVDPAWDSSADIRYSEWNKLMLPIHIKAKDGSWNYSAYVEDDLEYWGIDFTDLDLNTGESAIGAASWCQETWAYRSHRAHVRGRDNGDASQGAEVDKTGLSGWRPVLELVE